MKISKNLIIIAVFIIAAAGYLLRYNYLLRNLYFYQPKAIIEKDFPGLTNEQALMLGGGHSQDRHPTSSYLNFPQKKGPQTIRIGIFGCSLVEGDEAASGYDIASLLNTRFREHGMKNIEVINFGLTARGVHQMYLLWEFLGKDYSLDYVIFFPFSWHTLRDNAFTWSAFCYPPIYSRFILRDNDVKLIPVAGRTFREAYTTYYKIFPPLRYLRYSNKMPIFLRVLLPSMLHNRTNPLYYKLKFLKSDKQEIYQTYEILFSRLAKNAKNLIIVANDSQIYNLKKNLSLPNLYFFKSRVPDIINSFLYLAPLGHNSALGNQLRADELFYLLTGPKGHQLNTIKISPSLLYEKQKYKDSPLYPNPLYEYAKVSLNIGETPAAEFISYTPILQTGIEFTDFNFKQTKTASLLLVPHIIASTPTPNPSLMLTSYQETAIFLPLPFILKDNETVFLSFKNRSKMTKIPLGVVRAYGTVAIGEIILNADAKKLLAAKGAFKNASIMLQDKSILNSFFKPYALDFVYLRAKSNNVISIDDIKKNGNLDLVLKQDSSENKRYSLFSYQLISQDASGFTTDDYLILK